MFRHVINILLFIFPPSHFFALRSIFLRLSGIDISREVRVCGQGWIYGRGQLLLGKGSWISPRVIFYTHKSATISIGESCDVGPGVKFITGTHEIGSSRRRAGEGIAKPITIGKGCWLGAESIILGGVNIGEGAVVAAGSVVINDIPPNTLVAGVPATVRKNLSL